MSIDDSGAVPRPPAGEAPRAPERDGPRGVLERLRLLTRLAGLSYLAITVIARLPMAILPLTTLVMIVSWTNEILLGGYAAGIVALSIAVAVPVYGIVTHKVGQRMVLLFCVVANIFAVLWLISESYTLAEEGEGSAPRLLIACAVTGVTTAPVAALARIRWAFESQRLSSRTLLNSSLAFESVADVVAIVLGAAITGLVSVFWLPYTTLFLVIGINLLTVTAFAVIRIRGTQVAQTRPAEEEPCATARVRQRLIWFPVIGMGTLGLLLGSMQSSLVSFAINFDAVNTVGLLYAILGISSLIAALIVILLRVRIWSWASWLIAALLLTLVSLPVSVPDSLPTMALALVAEGIVVGVALVVTDSVAISVAPTRMLDVVMTSTIAALLTGTALGLTWGASLGESLGYNSALLLPLLSAVGYLVLAHLYGYFWRRHFEEPMPRVGPDGRVPPEGPRHAADAE
ncbi:hypothetical protein NBM05_09445 [Rothia sp. AR01]|uniref:Major facilitator superfamily (MFS) profile domain-containing protein n=1 Tax=Rothia santali TaxID=2949643 RepID=A0A9X2HDE0_9MICC|nr:hypothetical protein [Rothia santali]MCP3426225.1 hypothetical protein [Rothia santali]